MDLNNIMDKLLDAMKIMCKICLTRGIVMDFVNERRKQISSLFWIASQHLEELKHIADNHQFVMGNHKFVLAFNNLRNFSQNFVIANNKDVMYYHAFFAYLLNMKIASEDHFISFFQPPNTI